MSKALSITELADLLARNAGEYEEQSYDMPVPHDDVMPDLDAADAEQALAPVDAFAPRHFTPDPDVARVTGMAAIPQPSDEDPIRAAWKAGFEDGIATEKRLTREMRGEDMEAINGLRDQVRQIDIAAIQMMESRMREAVVALCHQVIDECPVSADRLVARIQTAVRMMTASHNHKSIEVSPEDLPLITGLLPQEWAVRANPDIARGAIRVISPEGGVEDGPEQWKLALEEAIRTC